jgi:hypothetical protein
MTSVFTRLQRSSDGPRAGFLKSGELEAARSYLARDSQLNLQLLDLVDAAGSKGAMRFGEPGLLGAWDGGEIVGVACLRPSLLFDAHLEARALHALLPYVGTIETGLIKSLEQVVTPLWEILRSRGLRSLIDRHEIAYALRPSTELDVPLPPGASATWSKNDLPT